MMFKEVVSKKIAMKCVAIILLFIVAILSMTVVSKIATSPETYKTTIQSIDEKKAAVAGVAASAALASTALAAVPGDVTTPIANQIIELTSYLLLVVGVLVLEKSLLTVMGYLSFNLLVPVACVLFGINTFLNKVTLKILAIKLVVFAIIIVAIIPCTMKISDMIYEINQPIIEETTIELEESVVETNDKEQSWIAKKIDKVKKTVSDAEKGIEEKAKQAKQLLNAFIDKIALFVIAYCALPIITVLVVVWIINFLFKINIPISTLNVKRIGGKGKNIERTEREEKELIEV